MPTVSVIVPNYNHAQFLKERLDSVFNQTFQDFEVILLDDASTDGSKKILEQYASHEKVSHFIVNEENSGSPFKQWKKGIELARGKWIWIAESDDIADKYFLESLLRISRSNDRIGILSCGLKVIKGEETGKFIPLENGVFDGAELIKNLFINGNILRNGSAVIFRKSALDNIIIDKIKNFRICGDWWLWVNILKDHNLGFKKEPLAEYRKHEAASSFDLSENPVFYDEASRILIDISNFNTIPKSNLQLAFSKWINRVKRSNIRIEEKRKLIANFKLHSPGGVSIRSKLYQIRKKTYKRLKKIWLNIKKYVYTGFRSDNQLILIYTPGKVGSSSVYHSLKKQFPFKEIWHIHFLGDTWLKKMEEGHEVFNRNIKLSERFYKRLEERKWNIRIITLVRDPVAREISGLFQTWQHIFDRPDVTDITLDEALGYLKDETFGYSEDWFKSDFKEFTGLNLFDSTFDKDKAYTIYRSNRGPVICLQMECLDEVYNEAMNQFLGNGTYRLERTNITADRSSGAFNVEVKKAFKLDKEKADKIYNSTFTQFFYNKIQIDLFRAKWTRL